MENLKLREPYKLSDLIKILADTIVDNDVNTLLDYEDMAFCLYTCKDNAKTTTDLVCYLEQYPDVNDDDEEIYSDFVVENGLRLLCFGDYLEDVIRNALNQKEQPSIEEYIAGLNYYLTNDTFIDL
jgi:hypothetical protein